MLMSIWDSCFEGASWKRTGDKLLLDDDVVFLQEHMGFVCAPQRCAKIRLTCLQVPVKSSKAVEYPLLFAKANQSKKRVTARARTRGLKHACLRQNAASCWAAKPAVSIGVGCAKTLIHFVRSVQRNVLKRCSTPTRCRVGCQEELVCCCLLTSGLLCRTFVPLLKPSCNLHFRDLRNLSVLTSRRQDRKNFQRAERFLEVRWKRSISYQRGLRIFGTVVKLCSVVSPAISPSRACTSLTILGPNRDNEESELLRC